MPLTELQAVVGQSAAALKKHFGPRRPELALILGSGLGGLVEHIGDRIDVPFHVLPGFPSATVPGHAGCVVAGTLEGVSVLAFAGRSHLYEGHPPAMTALPVRVAHALGVRTLFVSNAAGGIRRTFRPGDLMLIHDHINLMWRNPLIGPVAEGESRFPDMSRPYDPVLLAMFREAALDVGVSITEGVYAGVLGPSYETSAEIRMLERLGADAVGMSTVPEVLVARALDVRVVGVSCITNLAAGINPHPLNHAEVLAVAAQVQKKFERLVRRWVSAQAK